VSGLDEFARLVDGDHCLCVVSTLRADGTMQSSVVNAGVLPQRLFDSTARTSLKLADVTSIGPTA
jgi:hypothetical protein